MLEAEKQFRKVIGYTDLPRLAVAIERRPSTGQLCRRVRGGSLPARFGCAERRGHAATAMKRRDQVTSNGPAPKPVVVEKS